MQIDRDKIYLLGEYRYKNFTMLTDDEVRSVWQWRNDDSIRKYMYNPEIIPFDSHLKFVNGIGDRDDCSYWLVSKGGRTVGVANLSNIDSSGSRAELGFYMIPDMLNSGNGLDFAYHNFLFAFREIRCISLFGGIDKRNNSALILDSYLGCHLNADDICNLKKIRYVRWTIESEEFLKKGSDVNDIRKLVLFMRKNKKFFDELRTNAGLF